MTPGLLILLIFLTVYRTTRFVIEDTWPPLAWPRDRILNWLVPDEAYQQKHGWDDDGRFHKQPHLGALGRALRYLGSCPWCMSMWIGAPVIWGVAQFTSVPLPILVWASASAATGLLANLEEKLSS